MCRTIGRAITRREALRKFNCYLPEEAVGFSVYLPERRYYFLLD